MKKPKKQKAIKVKGSVGISLESVTLLNAHYETNERYRPKGNLLEAPICEPSYTYKKKGNELICKLKVDLRHGKRKAPVQLSAEFEAVYSLGNAPAVDVQKFAKLNAPAHLFPYVREYVAETTRRGRYSPLYLKPVNIANFLASK